MSDRYKNEIEKILEGSPDLPKEPPIQDETIESFRDQVGSLFRHARNRKLGSMSAFNILVVSITSFTLFFLTKINLFAVIGIGCLLVSYLTFIWPTSLGRPRSYFDKFMSWFNRLKKNTDK